ncbi:MAG: hypothetical protein E7461_00585 [Ruminococcaceae bacterium]|nr:hypothetical protein [Oscillospiraceae bacterium]
MAKEVRSLRLSEETVALIEKQDGSSFTDKFENLVQKCVRELPQKQRELKAVQQQISRERNNLEYIRKQQSALESNIRSLNYTLQNAESQATRVAKALAALMV